MAGLPLLVTEACGYAHYVLDADCGRVATQPFDQSAFNRLLAEMLASDRDRARWHANALRFA